MLQSMTIIRELTFEPGQSYTDVETIGKITSLCIMRWSDSMLCPGMVCVLCALQAQNTQQITNTNYRRPLLCGILFSSAIGIVIKLRIRHPRNRSSISTRDKRFFCSREHLGGLCSTPVLIFIGCWELFPLGEMCLG
jgi:hypothetical protein